MRLPGLKKKKKKQRNNAMASCKSRQFLNIFKLYGLSGNYNFFKYKHFSIHRERRKKTYQEFSIIINKTISKFIGINLISS